MADTEHHDRSALGRAAAARWSRPTLKRRRAPGDARVGTLAQRSSQFSAAAGRSIVARRAMGHVRPGQDTGGLPVRLDPRLWGAVELPDNRRSTALSGDPELDRLRRLTGTKRRPPAATLPPRGLPRASARSADSRAGQATGPGGAARRLRPSVAGITADPAVRAAGSGGGSSGPVPPGVRSIPAAGASPGPIRRLPAPAAPRPSSPSASASAGTAGSIAAALRGPTTAPRTSARARAQELAPAGGPPLGSSGPLASSPERPSAVRAGASPPRAGDPPGGARSRRRVLRAAPDPATATPPTSAPAAPAGAPATPSASMPSSSRSGPARRSPRSAPASADGGASRPVAPPHPATLLRRSFGPGGAGAVARAGASGIRPPAERSTMLTSSLAAGAPVRPTIEAGGMAVAASSSAIAALAGGSASVRPARTISAPTTPGMLAPTAGSATSSAASTATSTATQPTVRRQPAPLTPARRSVGAEGVATHPARSVTGLPIAHRTMPAPPSRSLAAVLRRSPAPAPGLVPAPPRGAPSARPAGLVQGATASPIWSTTAAAPAGRSAPSPAAPRGRAPRKADRFAAAASSRPADPVRPLPPVYAPLAQAITGGRSVGVSSGPASRRALAAASTRAATVGSVIHLPRPPAARPGPSELATMAHELVHAARPSMVPRLHGDDRRGAEERQADAVERAVGTMARRSRNAAPPSTSARPVGTTGLPVGGLTGLTGALGAAPTGAAASLAPPVPALSSSAASSSSGSRAPADTIRRALDAPAAPGRPVAGGHRGAARRPGPLAGGHRSPAVGTPAAAPPAPADAAGSADPVGNPAAASPAAAPTTSSSASPALAELEARIVETVRRRVIADLERRGLADPGVLW